MTQPMPSSTLPPPALGLGLTPPSNAFCYIPRLRLSQRKGPSPDYTKDSDLLLSIRRALRGQNLGQQPPTFAYSVPEDRSRDAEVEWLTWDQDTVYISSGGVIRKQWTFRKEGQTIQWACIAWLEQAGFEATSRSSAHYTSDYHSGPQRPMDHESTFGPFSKADRDRQLHSEPESRVRALFVFLRSIGKVYLENGLEYTFSLPFLVDKAWPLHPHGVLLLRKVEMTEMHEANLLGDELLPTLFTVTNPLAEATVVGVADKITGGFQSTPPSFIGDNQEHLQPVPPKERVVWVSTRSPGQDYDILVTVDDEMGQASIWHYVYIKPKEAPLTVGNNRSRRKRQSMPVNGSGPKRHSVAGNDSLAWNATPALDEHPLGKPPSSDSNGLPPLSALPGMPPSLSTTTTMASLAGANPTQAQQSQPPKPRRTSLGRHDLSSTLDRMALGGRVEADSSLGPTDPTKMRASYWMSRLYTFEMPKEKHRVNVAMFDQRFDGHKHPALLAICFCRNQKLIVLTISQNADKTLSVTPKAELCAISCCALNVTRSNVLDLVTIKPNGLLSVYTHGLRELCIAHPAQFPHALSESGCPVVQVKLESSNVDRPGGDTALRPLFLADPTRSAVTIILGPTLGIRSELNLIPHDTLTNQCLQILALALPSDSHFSLHTKFLQLWAERQLDHSDGVEFECFCAALYQTFGLESDDHAMATDTMVDSAWSRLSSTPSRSRFLEDRILDGLEMPPPPRPQSPTPPSEMPHPHLRPILIALHHLGEDIRLMAHRHHSLLRLVKLICRIAIVVRPEWADYWTRFCPDAMSGWTFISIKTEHIDDHIPVWPQDMSAILYGRISNPEWNLPWYESSKLVSQFKVSSSFAYGHLDPLAYLRQLTTIYKALAHKDEDSRKRTESAMMHMVKSKLGVNLMKFLSLGLAAPLREVVRTCQLSPGQDWPAAAYEFVGRNDLAEGAQAWSENLNAAGYRTVKEFLGPQNRKSYLDIVKDVGIAASGEVGAVSGVELGLDDFTQIRFGQDKRLDEVARMLRSSVVSSVKMVERPELSEHDQAKEQQNQVIRIGERTLALPLGRAMFTFGSVPVVTRESFSIPKMEFSIRLQPQNILITPDTNKIPPESLNWGDFHNGVAAALRISSTSDVVDSSWIKFNKPSELTPEHAGFLFGLGLTGHLKELLTWHTFGYLTPKHELTSIGVLLGLSAANVGSGNRHVTKLLAVHTPALLPTPSIDLNVPLITQAAGLVGIGLLFMGTKHRRMAEVCLKQISRSDLIQPDLSNEHREAYTFAAALAFGMVMLGKGSSPMIPADEALINELRILIHGEAPSHLRVGRSRSTFDINLTSPAATIALGLMYLKTNSQEVADILTVPDTVLALNRIPPNFLLLRTLSKALIMWDAIAPNQNWIDSQIPQSILKAMEDRQTGKPVDDALELAYHNIIAGCCFSIALKYAGTAREEPYVLLIGYYDLFSRLAYTNGPAFDHRIKRQAIRDGLNLISISLNMVMAGTGEINCLRRLRYSYGMYNQPMRYGTHMATHMSLGLLFLGGGRFTLGNSNAAVACMVAAFFPRFSPVSSDNKSYLQALRHLWVLATEPRCLVARDVDTKEIVYLPVKIKVKEGKETGVAQLISPTLIPDFDKLLSIRVDTPRYWPFYLDLSHVPRHKETLLRNQTIFVKRRTAFLSYLEDPKGSRSLFVRSGSSTGDAATLDFPRLTDTKAHPASDLNQFITSFSNDPFFLSFANHFCREDGETEEEQLFHAYCHASLLDSILQDKPQTLQSHMVLYRYRTMSPASQYFNLRLQDLRFAADFYGKVYDRRFSGRAENNARSPLIRDSTLSGTLYALDQQLEAIRASPAFLRTLAEYARGDALAALAAPDAAQRLTWYLLRNNVPVSTLLSVLRGLAQLAHTHCLTAPPPDGTQAVDALDMGIQAVLHATGSQMTTTLGSGWSMRSLEEIVQTWKEE
ncbi:hypothetical protein DENSPDRAFT_803509 [Dentipellis sp. KUC8613]|nr:hypothetical protein DENSPDRAFT_803509 [Dentipellis sp. KUC8613]